MPRRRERNSDDAPVRQRPAPTPDARETQMIELADELAERQLRDGTASAQVITHFLKLGSSRERMEKVKLGYETELIKAKTEAISKAEDQAELYKQALIAMSAYSGRPRPIFDDGPPDDEYYDD